MDMIDPVENNIKVRKVLDVFSKYFLSDKYIANGSISNDLQMLSVTDRQSLFDDLNYLLCGMPKHYLDMFKNDEKLKKKVIYEFDPLKRIVQDERVEFASKVLVPFVKRFDDVVMKHGYSMYFYGDNARGKTFTSLFLAYSINKAYVENYRILKNTFFYSNFQSLIAIYLGAMFEKDEYLSQMFNYVMSVDLLIIDEIGKEGKLNNHVIAAFEYILKSRINSKRPTITIGNMKPTRTDKDDHSTTILDHYGQSVLSALFERHRVFYFSSSENPDMRAVKKVWEF